MSGRPRLARWGLTLAAALATLVLAPAAASAHAAVSPAVSLVGRLQLYSLAVPTEKSGLETTRIVMTVPGGFGIDSLAPPPPGWHEQVQQSGSGENAAITRVTWSGGATPTGEDSVFQFLAQPSAARTYAFAVQQTYSDGSIVDWVGPESSDTPAPSISVLASLGGGGGGGGGASALPIVAVILGALGLAVGAFALVDTRGGGGKRPLA